MALPKDEWLEAAKRVPKGQQRRIVHKHERGTDLVVGNANDRWWAYCQRCKTGGVEMKTHVLTVQKELPKSRDLSIPPDMIGFNDCSEEIQNAIVKFLLSKGVDVYMFPIHTLWYSASRGRLMVRCVTGWMGRDLTGKSPEKWLTYSGQHYMSSNCPIGTVAVLVEDPFSMFKTQHAIDTSTLPRNAIDVYCCLGTKAHDSLMVRLIQRYTQIIPFMDGDAAGRKGAETIRRSVRALGLLSSVFKHTAPEGLDPKDMKTEAIRDHVRNELIVQKGTCG